jgi:hypothetical protein
MLAAEMSGTRIWGLSLRTISDKDNFHAKRRAARRPRSIQFFHDARNPPRGSDFTMSSAWDTKLGIQSETRARRAGPCAECSSMIWQSKSGWSQSQKGKVFIAECSELNMMGAENYVRTF